MSDFSPEGLLKACAAARRFPENTTPASRHVELIAEALLRGESYPMLQEDPEHVGGSLIATVTALYEAQNEVARLRAHIAEATTAARSWSAHLLVVEPLERAALKLVEGASTCSG